MFRIISLIGMLVTVMGAAPLIPGADKYVPDTMSNLLTFDFMNTAAAPDSEAQPIQIHLGGEIIIVSNYEVTDGDSFQVQYESGETDKVRLLNIDSPERAQRYGTDAKDNLDGLLQHEGVIAIYATERDQYGRLLANVYVGDRWINENQVRDGMAYTYFGKNTDEYEATVLSNAQKEAQAVGAGVHGCADCQSPRSYRQANPRQANPRQ